MTTRRRARPDVRTWRVLHEVASQTITSRPLANLYPARRRRVTARVWRGVLTFRKWLD